MYSHIFLVRTSITQDLEPSVTVDAFHVTEVSKDWTPEFLRTLKELDEETYNELSRETISTIQGMLLRKRYNTDLSLHIVRSDYKMSADVMQQHMNTLKEISNKELVKFLEESDAKMK